MTKWIALFAFISIVALGAYKLLRPIQDTEYSRAKYQIALLGLKIDSFRSDVGRYPTQLSELTGKAISGGPYARASEFVDPWKRPYYYRVTDGGKSFVLFTLGVDGHLGGSGQDRDQEYVPPANGG